MSNPLLGGNRPVKGGYWFIREQFRIEVDAAIAEDNKKLETPQAEVKASLDLGPPASSHPMPLEDPMQETAFAMVSRPQQPFERPQLPGLSNLLRPPVDLSDPNQGRPTFPPRPPSRT